jgi:hypothetical protein
VTLSNLTLFLDLLATEFKTPCKSPAKKNLLWFGFGPETYFVGREDKLAELQDYHFNERIEVAVISGLGGVGKSKLAFQYAKSTKESKNCVWLRGEDEPSFLNSINKLALKLKVPTKESSCPLECFEEMLSSIKSEISRTGDQSWLIILDNLDSMHKFVKPFFNCLWKAANVFIVVTSVLRNVASRQSTAVLMKLCGFNEKDSVDFIQERLNDSNVEFAKILSATLQSLPLAMDQAVQYILNQRNSESLKGEAYGIEDFLDEYNNQKIAKEILDYKLVENEKTLFTTVKMCFDRIEALEGGEGTVTLLHSLCYLEPDGIPLSFLVGLICKAEGSVDSLKKTINSA